METHSRAHKKRSTSNLSYCLLLIDNPLLSIHPCNLLNHCNIRNLCCHKDFLKKMFILNVVLDSQDVKYCDLLLNNQSSLSANFSFCDSVILLGSRRLLRIRFFSGVTTRTKDPFFSSSSVSSMRAINGRPRLTP